VSARDYDWFPPADRLYAGRPTPDDQRDIFQGDIFRDVPSYRYPFRPGQPDVEPRSSVGLAMVLGHPCELSPLEKGADLQWRLVCPVAEDRDRRLRPDGEGDFYAFPLPNLLEEEDLWYADFRFLGTIDRRYLDPSRRVSALSHPGWLALQRRLVHFLTRVQVHWADLQQAGEDLHPGE
jgi:hypothetical protein